MPETTYRPYELASVRIECRPGETVFPREKVLATLDTFQEVGVDAWWYAGSAPHGRPLFPSKHLPSLNDPDWQSIPWAIEQAHARGIAVYSHFCMNSSPLLLKEHPEYAIRFIDGPDEPSPRSCCQHSPHGQLVKDYAVELVRDIGFDGVWFDCSNMGWIDLNPRDRRFACCCDYCCAKFRAETGHELPRKTDWNDRVFRQWIRWRSECYTNYLDDVAMYVHERVPGKPIAFNHRTRLCHHTSGGTLMRRFKAPNVLMAAEADRRPQQVALQLKYLHAMAPQRPSESWSFVQDASYPVTPAKNPWPEPAGMTYYALACNAAGGFSSYGIHDATDTRPILKALCDALTPLHGHVAGDDLPYAGLVVSSRTLDLARDMTPVEFWQSAHGLHWMLQQLRLPSVAVLDDMIEDPASLAHLPLLLLPDVRAMTDRAAHGIEQYVRAGGTLVAFGQSGRLDELGQTRERGALDELLGISQWGAVHREVRLEPVQSMGDLPESFLVSGLGTLARSAADVIARGVTHVNATRDPAPTSDDPHHAITVRSVDKGRAVFVAPNIGQVYAQSHNRRARAVVDHLLRRFAKPPFEVEAPIAVSVDIRKQAAGKLVVHLFNNHPTMQMLRDDIPDMHWPEDVSPTGPIRVTIPGAFRVSKQVGPRRATVEARGGETILDLAMLDVHQLVVLEPVG
jgi:hypothetical protein